MPSKKAEEQIIHWEALIRNFPGRLSDRGFCIPQYIQFEHRNDLWGFDMVSASLHMQYAGDKLETQKPRCTKLASGAAAILASCGWFSPLANSAKFSQASTSFSRLQPNSRGDPLN